MSDLHDQIRHKLHSGGIRYTNGRRTVVETIREAPGPMTAAELADRIGPSVPVSSLYRSLGVLVEAGVVARHLGADGTSRYEPAEWIAGHHHHVVCVSCGAMEDVELDADAEAAISIAASRMAKRAGYRSRGHGFEVEGVCASCA